MAKKVKDENHDIRSSLPPGQKCKLENAIRTQSEQLLILKKVRYLDGGDVNISIPTEGSDLPDRAGPTSPESIAADGGPSGYFDADLDDEALERTNGPDPADLVGSTPLKPILMEGVAMSKNAGPAGARIHYKKDGFLVMANAGRIFRNLHSNKGYIPVSFHEFKQRAKCCVYTRLQNGSAIYSTLAYTRLRHKPKVVLGRDTLTARYVIILKVLHSSCESLVLVFEPFMSYDFLIIYFGLFNLQIFFSATGKWVTRRRLVTVCINRASSVRTMSLFSDNFLC